LTASQTSHRLLSWADVTINKPLLFKKGNLSESVRASMTYPFYMNPIKVNGSFLYDGGIYNNFPSDIMYNDFLPDIIIGCNLSDTLILDDQDFISQLKSIILSRKDNNSVCENSIIIKPNTNEICRCTSPE
jgi:NTE family protein